MTYQFCTPRFLKDHSVWKNSGFVHEKNGREAARKIRYVWLKKYLFMEVSSPTSFGGNRVETSNDSVLLQVSLVQLFHFPWCSQRGTAKSEIPTKPLWLINQLPPPNLPPHPELAGLMITPFEKTHCFPFLRLKCSTLYFLRFFFFVTMGGSKGRLTTAIFSAHRNSQRNQQVGSDHRFLGCVEKGVSGWKSLQSLGPCFHGVGLV